MVTDVHIEYVFQGLLDILDSRVTEFDHLSGVSTDDVVMLLMLE